MRWLVVGMGVATGLAACAGSNPGATSDAPHPPASAAPVASATFPYLDFDPDRSGTADAGDAGAGHDAAPADAAPAKVLPPPPSCKAVATTAPLSVDGDKLVDSPTDPRLASVRQAMQGLSRRNVQCKVGHNDGRLFNLECASAYANADGNIRPGGVESHLFEWNGRRFEPVALKQLFPGGKSLASVLKSACNTDDGSVYQKIWLDHAGMSFVAGLSPLDESGCRLEYAEHADWVGCGPLAYLAGYAPRAPAPDTALPEPLGWDNGRVMSRLPAQQDLVKRVNALLDGFYAQVKADSSVQLECAPVFSNNQVVSLQCSRDYSTKLRLNYAVRSGAELDIDALIAVAGPKLVNAVNAACNKQYKKRPTSEYELFSKSPIKLARDDLTAFEFHASALRFHVEIELQMRGDSPSKREATCDVPWKSAGLSLEKLGAVSASTQ
ncbi:MAG: hypothetical protein AB7K71_13695 [Polyangiaceae bacterium]